MIPTHRQPPQTGEHNFTRRRRGVLSEQVWRFVHDNGSVVAHIAQRSELAVYDGVDLVGAAGSRVVATFFREGEQALAVDGTQIGLDGGLGRFCDAGSGCDAHMVSD